MSSFFPGGSIGPSDGTSFQTAIPGARLEQGGSSYYSTIPGQRIPLPSGGVHAPPPPPIPNDPSDRITPPPRTNTYSPPLPPHKQFAPDINGQPIVRTIGLNRVALKIIWAKQIQQLITVTSEEFPDPIALLTQQGPGGAGEITVSESGQVTVSAGATMTFAAALCAPIDPDEGGTVWQMWDGADVIYDPTKGGSVVPDGWEPGDGVKLTQALNTLAVYPGTEWQLPDPRIVADKGITVANAFRGIRYIVLEDYPIKRGFPLLSIVWRSPASNDTTGTRRRGKNNNDVAVEFAAGSG